MNANKSKLTQWNLAVVAVIVNLAAFFQDGPSRDIVIIGTPVAISIIVSIIGSWLLNAEEILETIKKFNILILFSPTVGFPLLVYYFLKQNQYGAMLLIAGAVNIVLVTLVQALMVSLFYLMWKTIFCRSKQIHKNI